LLISILLLIVLTLISGVLSSSEIALSSANRNRVKMRADAGDKKAERLLAVMDEPNNFFATTQLYITFIAFFIGAFAANTFTEPLVEWVQTLGLPISNSMAEPIAFILITVLLTYFTLILGELVPKRIAMQYAIPFALRAVVLLRVLSFLAMPFVKVLSATAQGVLRILGIKEDGPEADVTKEEIRLMVESGNEHGNIDESEQDMIENIFAFDTRTSADICTHRLDVVALPMDAEFQTVITLLIEEGYSRVPVYEESLDNVRGILHAKDMMKYMATHPETASFRLQPLLREPYFVPLSKKTSELFQEMRRERVYLAVVIDEYGGTMGIVTMEDLVEEIVGNIHDEYDRDELLDIQPLDEKRFQVQGTVYLEEVQDFFDVPLPVDEYDTLSGFLVGQLGHVPEDKDERAEFPFNGLLFSIDSVQEKRIATATVSRLETDAEASLGQE